MERARNEEPMVDSSTKMIRIMRKIFQQAIIGICNSNFKK